MTSITLLGPKVAEGRTAELYAWREGQIIKFLREGFRPDDLYREARHTRLAAAAGLPVPRFIEEVRLRGKPGIVYERVDGKPMTEHIRPLSALRLGRTMADLHIVMHRCVAPSLRQQREIINHAVAQWPEKFRRYASQLLAALPHGDKLCHGDMHPGNILMSPRGPVVIDWNDAVQGDPVADVARTLVLLNVVPAPKGIPEMLYKVTLALFQQGYIRRYRKFDPDLNKTLAAWEYIIALALVDEGIEGTEARLAQLAARKRSQIDS
jgi:aminoglycoside phosphotransferase (APT) family kinase protein